MDLAESWWWWLQIEGTWRRYTGGEGNAERAFRFFLMLRLQWAKQIAAWPVILLCSAAAGGQPQTLGIQVTVTVVDETGRPVPDAQVTIAEPGLEPVNLRTNFGGNCTYALHEGQPYTIHVEKPGFYRTDQNEADASQKDVHVTLAHEQIVREQVNVTASTPGIDTEQESDQMTLDLPAIVNIPFAVSNDIRGLLPYFPGVVADASGQVHVAGSETWETLDTMDGFDMRSPVSGSLSLRVSTDAVRSIDQESTRYPVQYGRATGGVVAYYTGMGDDKFRFNMTNFFPSFRELNGLQFEQFVPRFTFSGPLKRGKIWWYDGVDLEFDNIYVPALPANANTDLVSRGSNLVKAQANLTSGNILTAGLLYNDYHSPYSGLSSLTPRQSTVKNNIIAWFPYLRDQQSFGGALLDVGVGYTSIGDGNEPYGNTPYQITPELQQGSYFENLSGRSQRLEGTATLYLPPKHWAGRHDLRAGIDLDHITYNQDQTLAPVSYLGESTTAGQNGPLVRQSTFAPAGPFTLHNAEIGAYFEDRWTPAKGWVIEPGVRFDWDEIVRRPLVAPRLAAVYAPPGDENKTKISAGIGLYYEHTQLEYLTRTFTGVRTDTCYQECELNGTTQFTANNGLLQEPRAINWSVAAERELPWKIFAGANFMEKRTSSLFTFVNESGTGAQAGNYLLTNGREDHYSSEQVDARRQFGSEYMLFVAYTHSSARTNAALDYLPTPSPLGPQQSGPLAWNAPNRLISWGWLPVPIARLRKRWDFVYLFDRRTGFPYTAVNATDQVVGAAGAYRFPEWVDFSPGLELKFHFRGQYWGLRGVIENATGAENPLVVNNVMDSPEFGMFTEPQGRSFTARIRLIGTK